MADGINGNKGIDFINSILKGLGVEDVKVKSSDVASIFSEAEDKNGNGQIDKDEFTEAIASYYKTDIENISDLEDDYLDAWNAFANIDGNDSGLSASDISGMNAQVADAAAKSDANYANNENYTAPTEKQTSKTPTVAAVSADSLAGKSSSDLSAERSDLLSQLNDKRTEKNDNSAVNEKKEEVDSLKEAYDDALEELENDEIKDENEKSLNDLKAEKEEKDGQIEDQNGVISDLNDSIDSQNTLIDSLNSELDGLQEPSESDYMKTVTDEDGNTHEELDTAAYNAAMQEYEEQKAELEEKIAEAEDVLAELEENLADAEDALTTLEEEAAAIDEDIQSLTEQILENDQDNEQATAVKEALEAYNQGQEELKALEETQTAQLDADINQLQENLSAYDEAIATAEAEEAEEAKAAENEQKAQLGLTDDERIQIDDEGNAYVEVEPWKSTDNGNDCLSRIMDNNYDYEALGIERGSEEYNKLQDAVMDANSEIYGTEENEGRNRIFDGSRENSVLYDGDKIVLPDAYEVLGLEKPTAPENTEDSTPVIQSADDIPSCVNVADTDTVTVNDNGTFKIKHEDGSYEEHSSLEFDENGNLTSEKVYKFSSTGSYPETTQEKTYSYDDENTLKTENTVSSNIQGAVTSESYKSYNDDGSYDEYLYTKPTDGENAYHNVHNESDRAYSEMQATHYDKDGNAIDSTNYTIDENGKKVHQQTISNGEPVDPSTQPKTETETDESNVWDAEIEEGTKAAEYLDQISSYAETDGCNVNSTQAQNFFKEKINEAMNDPEVTSQEKIKLLSQMNDISADVVKDMAEYDCLNNEYVDILEEAANSGNYSVDQIIELDKQYKAITGQADEEHLGIGIVSDDMRMPPMDRYIDTIISLYDGASPEEMQKLNSEFDIGTLIQSQYAHGKETEKLKTLFNNMESGAEDFLNSYMENNPNSVENWNAQYGQPSKSAFKNVMEGLDNFNSDESKAAALLNACGGDMDTLVDYFRSYSSSNQEKYLGTLLNIFAGADAQNLSSVNNDASSVQPETEAVNKDIPADSKAQDYLDSLTSYANTDGCDLNSTQAQNFFKEKINEALNDPELTPQQKMALISTMNDISSDLVNEMAEYDSLNNEYVDILEEAVNSGNYTVDQIIELNNQYKELTGQVDEEHLGIGIVSDDMRMPPMDRYIDTIISLYDGASPEEMQKLNSEFDIGTLIQSQYAHGKETEKLKTLFNNIEGNPENVLNEYLADNKNAAENWNSQYGKPGKKAFKNIMAEVDNFSTTKGAVAALLNACNGNMDTLVDYFRDLGKNDQEKYLPVLLELFGGSYFED